MIGTERVWVVNDFARRGVFGEPVLWTYLIERLGFRCVDYGTTGATTVLELRAWCEAEVARAGTPALVIQNATNVPLYVDGAPTIAVLQDDLRAMFGPAAATWQDSVLVPATRVVCNGAGILEDYPDVAAKATVIPIGVDGEFFRPADRFRRSRGPGVLDVVFVGLPSETKGFGLASAVFDHFPAWGWTWVLKVEGAGPRGRTFVRAPRERMAELYRESDVLLVASPVETLCIAAVEAMLSGCRVVSSATGVFSDWRPEGATIVSRTEEAFVRALRELAHEERFDRTIPRAAVLARPDLSIDGTVRAWRALVEALVGPLERDW